MKNLQELVRWTRYGLAGLFTLGMLGELILGVMAINNDFPFLENTNYSFKTWVNLLGVLLLLLELFMVRLLYKSQLEYIHLMDNLEGKLKKYGQLSAFGLLALVLTGITALFGYTITNELMWFLPWLLILYIIGWCFPFKLTMIHQLKIEDEEEKELFIGKNQE